jgi:hypothetical protein
MIDYQPMKADPLKDGIVTENSAGIGRVTLKTVRARAAELAIIDGHLSSEATESHFALAKRELTGVPDSDPKDAILESTPESERWDPVPGSTGHKMRAFPSEDEDDEGRSDDERLVEGGIAEAALEQSLQATRVAAKKDL